jgi:type I restriction enzyme S subunit
MVSKEEIPDHWDIRTIGDLASIENGYGFKKEYQGHKNKPIPFYKVSDMNSRGNEVWMQNSNHTIDEEMKEEMSVKAYPEGTTIFPKIGEAVRTNKKRILSESAVFDNNVMGVVPDESKVDQKYIYYYMQIVDLSDFIRETAVPSIRQSDIADTEIPVPPLEEQEMIVEKLDNIFQRITEIQKAQGQVEKIYQDVAFSFFTSRVRDAETDTVETDELIESTQYGSSNATNSEGDGYPSLRMGNYNLRGEMDYSKIKYQDLEDDDFEKYRVEKGDVLFNRTNSKDLVGKMCVYDGGLEDAVFASYLIRVELNEDRVLPEYFVTYMNSHLGEVERQGKLKQAVSQANINATELREMEMAVPSLERQKGIVKSLNYMRSKVDDIKSEVDKKGKLIEDMPNSILAEAFKGNLVDFGAMSEPDELGSTEQGIDEKQESSFDGEGQQSLGEYR